MTKKCINPNCGKEFQPKSAKGVYCSATCKSKHQYLLKKQEASNQIKDNKEPAKDPTRPWIEEIEAYCREKGLFPDYLIEFHKTHANSATIKAIEGLKKALNIPHANSERKLILQGQGKNREMYEPEEGTNAHILRYGVAYKKDIPK